MQERNSRQRTGGGIQYARGSTDEQGIPADGRGTHVAVTSNHAIPSGGDGEAGGISHIGLIIYSSLVILLVYKVLYESRTIIYGNWPPCWHARKDGFWSNVPYSWYGVTIGSLYFNFFFFLPIYNVSLQNTRTKAISFPKYLTCFCYRFFSVHLEKYREKRLEWIFQFQWNRPSRFFDEFCDLHSTRIYPYCCDGFRCVLEGIFKHVLSNTDSNTY